MNQFTKDFLFNDFPKIEYEFHPDMHDLRDSCVPAIEIPIGQLQQLHKIYRRCQQLENQFLDISTGQFFNHWYTRPRSQGWKELCVLYKQVGIRDMVNSDKIHYRKNIVTSDDMELKRLCIDLFDNVDISIEQIVILKLEPKGWINPHKDNVEIPVGLGYFWIPLHHFDPALKVFPFGWLNHSLGNLYLFNHCQYVHAAYNNMDKNRYVMIGRLNLSKKSSVIDQNKILSYTNWRQLWI